MNYYQQAQTAQQKSDNLLAAQSYLQAYLYDEKDHVIITQHLQELTHTSASMSVRVYWGICEGFSQHWEAAYTILAPMADKPVHLSPKLLKRWKDIQTRTLETPQWVHILRIMDRVISLGFIDEALMFVNHAVVKVKHHSQLGIVLLEAARFALMNGHVQSGVDSIESLLGLLPHMKTQVIRLFDEILLQEDLEQNHVKTIVYRRIEMMDQVLEYGDEVIQYSLDHKNWEFLIKVLAALQSQNRYLLTQSIYFKIISNHLFPEGFRLRCVDLCSHMILAHLPTQEEQWINLLKSESLYAPLETYLLYKLRQVNHQEQQADLLNACAHIAILLRKNFQDGIAYLQDGIKIHPKSIQLKQLIHAARNQQEWESLDILLSMQLQYTNSKEKKQAILRAQAHSRLQRENFVSCYLAQIAALSLDENKELWIELLSLLKRDGVIQKVEQWILDWLDHDDFLDIEWWQQEVLQFYQCLQRFEKKYPHYTLPSTHQEDLQDQFTNLSTHFLCRTMNKQPHLWNLVDPFLKDLISQDLTQDLIHYIVTLPKTHWPLQQKLTYIEHALQWVESEQNTSYAEPKEETSNPIDIQQPVNPTTKSNRHDVSLIEYKLPLYKEYAEISSELKLDATLCLARWNQYLDLAPGDRHAIEFFREAAESLNQWEELLYRYQAAIPLRMTGRVHLYELCAEIHDKKLNDKDQAAQAWYEVIQLNSHHQRAGIWLSEYYCIQENWHALLNLTDHWQADETKEWIWHESLLRAYIGLKDLNAAYECWHNLVLTSSKALFFEVLLDLVKEKKNAQYLYELLSYDQEAYQYEQELVFGFEDLWSKLTPEEQNRHIYRLTLRAQALTDWQNTTDELQAIKIWRKILQMSPWDKTSIESLLRLYTETGMSMELSILLGDISSYAEHHPEYYDSLLQGVAYLESRFHNYEDAFHYWSLIYHHSHYQARALLAMKRLLRLHTKQSTTYELSNSLDQILEVEQKYYQSQLDEVHQKSIVWQRIEIQKRNYHWGDLYQHLSLLKELKADEALLLHLHKELLFPLNLWDVTCDYIRSWVTNLPHNSSIKAYYLSWVASVYETRLERPSDAAYLYQIAMESDPLHSHQYARELQRIKQYLDHNTAPNEIQIHDELYN